MKRMTITVPGYMGRGEKEVTGWGEGNLMVAKSGKYWSLYHIPSCLTIGSINLAVSISPKSLAYRKDEIRQLNQMKVDWSKSSLDEIVESFEGTREEFIATVVDITGTGGKV